MLKAIHKQRHEAAKKNTVRVDVQSAKLLHTQRAWIGKLASQDGSEAPPIGSQLVLPPGLGQHSYTQEEINHLTDTTDFTYIHWLGERAQEGNPFPSVSRGLSHGGGQLRPGELQNHPDNVAISDEMLAHEYFK
ncbi:hypothetical protein C8R45DRAFT_1115741 [Mycena sanguinolenta]|nr:hypothetical protein C8R45DRAFT_1115741 [Mycena sanguinolenta]